MGIEVRMTKLEVYHPKAQDMEPKRKLGAQCPVPQTIVATTPEPMEKDRDMIETKILRWF